MLEDLDLLDKTSQTLMQILENGQQSQDSLSNTDKTTFVELCASADTLATVDVVNKEDIISSIITGSQNEAVNNLEPG